MTNPIQPFESLRRIALDFRPARILVSGKERVRAVLGGGLGILFTALVCRALIGLGPGAWIVAPIGASAVLVFALPASPLAQPWAVIGGNSISALVGILCGMAIPNPAWAGATAVALAIGTMFSLRCLHPPGGAAALLCALSGVSLSFVLFPMTVNCVLLVLAGMAYNRLSGRRYPHAQAVSEATVAGAASASRFSAADLDVALAHYNQVLDISRDDLEQLLHHAEATAYQRSFGELCCADIMTRDPMTVEFGTPLIEAWRVLQQRQVKALPVVDRARRVIGIVTLADFMRLAGIDAPEGLGARLQTLVRPSGRSHSDRSEVVGQIMNPGVLCATVSQRVSELVPLYAQSGHHHLPVIDEERRLVGMVTESNLVRALYRVVRVD